MSWALSCLQLKKYYSQVELYSDKITSDLLINQLNLPYSTVHCELDVLNKYDKELWAIPKIYAYSKQNQPFLHVDGDVYIWDAFDHNLISNNLIAQNLESATNHYNSIMLDLERHLNYFPPEILEERKNNNPILAYNAGIFGGADYDFFKTYCEKAFTFVNKNVNDFPKISVHNFNIFFEQYLFYCLAKKDNKKVGVLFDQVIGDNEYKGFGDFIEIPHYKKYLHLLGNYKKSEVVCIQLANRLRQDYPEFYYKIIALYKKNNIPLLHDYYLDEDNELSLLERSRILKKKYHIGRIPKEVYKPRQFIESSPIVSQTLNDEEQRDFNLFFKKVNNFKKAKFSKFSLDYLYGRDLNVTQYFELLFADEGNILKKTLVSTQDCIIIESRYDWSLIDNSTNHFQKKNQLKKSVLTMMVPESNVKGYSLNNIDRLDVEIINILKEKKTVGELLRICKNLFNDQDLAHSKEEFKKLIFGRIKKALHNKSIKPIYY